MATQREEWHQETRLESSKDCILHNFINHVGQILLIIDLGIFLQYMH